MANGQPAVASFPTIPALAPTHAPSIPPCRCNALAFPPLPDAPGAPARGKCSPDARARCDAPGMRACDACYNWAVAASQCGPAGAPAGPHACERSGGYAVMRQAPSAGPGRRCVAADRWVVLPDAACTGIEDPDPRCTGAAGEALWHRAWEEGLRRGMPAPRGGGGGGGAAPPEWALVMAAPPRRSHQQMHVHVGRLAPPGLPVADAFRAGGLGARRGRVSCDPAAPSVLALAVGNVTGDSRSGDGIGSSTREAAVILLSVFVAAEGAQSGMPAGVRPFATARAAAAAHRAAAGVSYALVVTARSQPACEGATGGGGVSGPEDAGSNAAGMRSKALVPGFVITAMLGGEQWWLLAEEPTSDCFDVCPLPPGAPVAGCEAQPGGAAT